MKLNEIKLLHENYDFVHNFSTKEGIDRWLSKSNGNPSHLYQIHDDLTVSSDHSILIKNIGNLTELPVKFTKANYFTVFDVPLTSLKNFPDEVYSHLFIDNTNIVDLKGISQVCPSYKIRKCNELKTLEGLPTHLEGSLVIFNCSNLDSLKGSPISVSGDVEISNCKNLKSLKGGPREVNGYFDVTASGLTSLKYSPKYIGQTYYADGNPLQSLEGIEKTEIGTGVLHVSNTQIPKESKTNYPDLLVVLGEQLEEGWKEKAQVAGAAALMATALLVNRGPEKVEKPQNDTVIGKIDHSNVEVESDKSNIFSGIAKKLYIEAKNQGIHGVELIQLMAQTAHESLNFTRLEEMGSKIRFNRYDKLHNPQRAKELGNTEIGDGEKYKGRGLIQLTGRYNYRMAGRALNLPLEDQPELAADPKIAIDITIWYWKTRVRPKVEDFSNVEEVTKPINKGLKGLDDRKEKFRKFSNLYNLEIEDEK